MLRKLVFVGMILVLMVSFSVVLADQDGKTCWCNVDKDGCWVTNEEGGKDYIMFWSEASRKFFMGDSTAPYTNVVSKAEGATLGLICGIPNSSSAGRNYCLLDENGEKHCFTKSEIDEILKGAQDSMPDYDCKYYQEEMKIECVSKEVTILK